MSKLITFAVPCYNSAAYMEHCVETLLTGGEDVEIILVDDVMYTGRSTRAALERLPPPIWATSTLCLKPFTERLPSSSSMDGASTQIPAL